MSDGMVNGVPSTVQGTPSPRPWARRQCRLRKLGRALLGAAFCLLSMGALYVVFFTNHVYVTTPSMYPTLPPGSIAIIEKAPAYHVGDIIEFHGNGLVFMHRIIKISANGDITTKGDNPENAPDVFSPPTTSADVIGRVVFGAHWLGFPELFAHHPSYALAWLRAELTFRAKLAVIAVSGACFLIFSRAPDKKRAAVLPPAGAEAS